MRNTHLAERRIAAGIACALAAMCSHAAPTAPNAAMQTQVASETLSIRQQAIIPIAAWGAAGDMSRLAAALTQGLDAGLTVNEAKEVLVQLYAYAGFPRSLNALSE